jgi:hypothetical protein
VGFRFRKSLRLAPGFRINLSKNGLSSLSIGKRGAIFNVGAKGEKVTVGMPGTGLSYSRQISERRSLDTEPSGRAKPVRIVVWLIAIFAVLAVAGAAASSLMQ